MNKKSNSVIKIIILFYVFSGFLLFGAFHSAYISTLGAVTMWSAGIVYAVKSIKHRFAMFSFYVGYFVFLLGGYVLYLLKTNTFNYFPNSEKAITHTCFCLFLSISLITISSYFVYSKMQPRKEECFVPGKRNEISQAALQLLIVILVWSFICKFLIEAARTSFYISTAYANTDLRLNFPAIIKHPASWFYISLFLYWGTFPATKKVYITLALLLVVEVTILISGERGEPISLFFSVAFYITLRKRAGFRDFAIQKKYILLSLFVVPLLVAYLQILSETRMKREYDFQHSNVFFDFFESQGVSARIIATGYELRQAISAVGGRTYVLGEIRNYLKTNIFTRMFTGSSYVNDKYALAESGDLYSCTYMVLWSPVSFANGIGSGTTYIAEAYHDGSYFFLIIISILYSFLFYKVENYKRGDSFILTAIRLNILRYIVMLPRGYSLAWLTITFSFPNIILFFILYSLCNHKMHTDYENPVFDTRLPFKD